MLPGDVPLSESAVRSLKRPSNRLRTARRLLASFVALCLFLGFGEQMIPDRHDGGTEATATTAPATTADAHASSLILAASDDGASHESGTRTAPPHDFHLDHCGHAHCMVVPVNPPASPAPLRTVTGIVHTVGRLTGIDRSPDSRPPIPSARA